jgi:hypothetical protein
MSPDSGMLACHSEVFCLFIYLFTYGLFSGALLSSECMTLNGRMLVNS